MYENCRNEDCKAPLLPTKVPRDAPRQCSKCKKDSYVSRLKGIQRECLEQQVIVPEEMFFEDAIVEEDNFIYKRKHVDHFHMQSTIKDMLDYSM